MLLYERLGSIETKLNTLKVVQLHYNETLLIEKAKAKDLQAQRAIYERFAPKMLSVCRQYISDMFYAEDVLLSGFLKVFTKLDQFDNRGSFEGWIRRIMVTSCISHLRSQKRLVFLEDYPETQLVESTSSHNNLEIEDIQKRIDELPENQKVIFLMYAIDGYSHQEISQELQITVSASKTQLHRARKCLQHQLKDLKITKNETVGI